MTDVWYLWIKPQQPPYDAELDDPGRAQVAFFIMARKQKSGTFLEELAKILTDAGVDESVIHAGTTAFIPDGEGAYLHIKETPGPGDVRTQNTRGTSYQQPMALITVHAKNYDDARELAQTAYNAFDDVTNQSVTLP